MTDISGEGDTAHDHLGDFSGPASPTARLWSLLGGEASALERVRHRPAPGLGARLPVQDLARATTAVCALAAAGYAAPGASVEVDDARVAAAFHSERLLRVEGRAVNAFAPLSRFWRTADGWVRTHANYPHHRARLLAALSVPDRGSDATQVERVGARLAGARAREVERDVFAAGGLAVAVRTEREWRDHPQGAVCAAGPPLSIEQLDQAAPLAVPDPSALRVLDLTRVLAGPVATRTLALLGADVLRVDAPWLPESADTHADVGVGKRTTRLDLAQSTDRTTFEELLSSAHVVVTGYRPGALDRFGLSAAALAERRPGLVIGQLSAWGERGPWAERRGFDSLVQAASGIALIEGEGDRPGALPVQALDHGSGYLLAAALLQALNARRAGLPGSALVRVVLARTAHWLLTEPRTAKATHTTATVDTAPWLRARDSPLGRLRYARSPLVYDGGPTDWARPPGKWGEDLPRWRQEGN